MSHRSIESTNAPLRRLCVAVGAFLFCAMLMVATPVLADEDPIKSAAESFFGLVDAGSYQQAWWECSELLQMTTSLDSWVEEVRTQRALFGDAVERKVKTLSERSSQPGFPDGEYALVLYDSRYENKKKALELLVLKKGPYGEWKVVSFRLR